MNFNDFKPIVHNEMRYHFVGQCYRISDAKGVANTGIDTPHVGVEKFIKSKKPKLSKIARIDLNKYQYLVQAFKSREYCNVCGKIPDTIGVVKNGKKTVICPNCNGTGFIPSITKKIEISGIKIDSEIFAQIITESKVLHLVYLKDQQIVLQSDVATYYLNF